MTYITLFLVCVWTLLLVILGMKAYEEREWRIFWGAVLLLVASLVVVLGWGVMLSRT